MRKADIQRTQHHAEREEFRMSTSTIQLKDNKDTSPFKYGIDGAGINPHIYIFSPLTVSRISS